MFEGKTDCLKKDEGVCSPPVKYEKIIKPESKIILPPPTSLATDTGPSDSKLKNEEDASALRKEKIHQLLDRNIFFGLNQTIFREQAKTSNSPLLISSRLQQRSRTRERRFQVPKYGANSTSESKSKIIDASELSAIKFRKKMYNMNLANRGAVIKKLQESTISVDQTQKQIFHRSLSEFDNLSEDVQTPRQIMKKK